MKKKTRLWIAAGVLLLIILFAPIPGSPCKDGGTRAYSALTYKIVKWQRDTGSDVYKATKVYWLPNNFKCKKDISCCFCMFITRHFIFRNRLRNIKIFI